MMNSRWDLDGWKKTSTGEWPKQPLDYAVSPGDPIPPVHKTTWLDRLWDWVKRP